MLAYVVLSRQTDKHPERPRHVDIFAVSRRCAFSALQANIAAVFYTIAPCWASHSMQL